ncbi:MAG: hypothetical protein ACRDH7_00700 [Actinomycetota bacterium]
MARSRRSTRWLIPTSLATLILITALVAPAFAATTKKPYAVVMTPASVGAGSIATFTATFFNETSTQQLGSANLTLPAGFTPVSVGAPPIGTATLVGSTIQLRNLATVPGASTSVSVAAQAPCPLGTYTWSVIAKQANNFTGDPGNDLTFDPANSALATTLTGTCHLGFAFVAQPASAQVGTAITTVTYDPSAPPVTVQVLDGNGNPITSSTAPIALSILDNPGGGTLSGATTVNATGGEASFPGISIDRAGLDYTLAASTSVAAIDPTASAAFNIANVGKRCSAASCSSGTITQGSTSASELANAGAAGDLLSLYVSVEPLDCPGYAETSAVVTFDVTGSRTKSVTITVPKAGLKPTKIRVCFSSPTAFVDRSGATVTLGLLPDCSVSVAPCVTSVKVVQSTMVTVFQTPAGDPRGRV